MDHWDDFFTELEICSIDEINIKNNSQCQSDDDKKISQSTNNIPLSKDIPMMSYISNGQLLIPDQLRPKTYDSFLENKEIKMPEESNNTICVSCNAQLYANKNLLICQECGLEIPNTFDMTEEEYSVSATTECNVNTNGFIAMKMIGRGAYGYQRSLLKTCANYSKYRRINTFKDMKNWNIHSKKHHIPKNVIQEANDMFAQIKEKGFVFRKDGKKGVLSACLYYACYNNNITKTPAEVAHFSGIEEKFHSLGDRILHDLNERGIIEIPIKVNPIADYIERYMTLLSIPKKYKPFVIDLIDRANKKHIHVLHDSKNNTRCVGAIYMLIDRVPELKQRITKDQIDKECGISKTTFIRYYLILCKYYKKLKKVFKKHRIPMKPEWRN